MITAPAKTAPQSGSLWDVACTGTGVGLAGGVGLKAVAALTVGDAVPVGAGEGVNDAGLLGVGPGRVGVGVRVAKATTATQDGSSSVWQSSAHCSTIRRGKAQSPFRRTVTWVSHAGEVGGSS